MASLEAMSTQCGDWVLMSSQFTVFIVSRVYTRGFFNIKKECILSITKEQWKEVETNLSGYFARIVFSYKGHELTVTRERSSESSTVLVVYIDGKYSSAWGYPDIETKEPKPAIIPDVWRARSKSIYSPKRIKELEKLLGKRESKKSNIYDKLFYHEPFFSKASVLVRQYKKLDGIALLEQDALL